ncbi:MAG: SAM-dependent methyltransferase, partial [Sciscionella sp.]
MHEVAQAANPAARVAYVDSDPVAAAHAARLLADVPNVQVLRADLREPATVIRAAAQPEPSRGGLDFSRPVGVLLVSVLPFIP